MSSELTSLTAALDANAAGTWVSLKDIGENTFRDVAFTEREHEELVAQAGGQAFWGAGSGKGVLERWNGAAFDEAGNKLYFFGGGHFAYGGNEVYEFDLEQLEWSRLTDPAPLTGPEMSPGDDSTNPAPAEGPASRHTYDGFTWHPTTQSVWLTQNGTNFIQRGEGPQPNDPTFWEFDPATREWTGYDLTERDVPNGSEFPIAAFNPETGQLVVDSKAPNAVHIIQPDGTIEARSSVAEVGNKILGNMEYNPADGKMYFVRDGTIYRAQQDANGNLVWESFVDDLPASFPGGKGGYTYSGFDFHEPSGRMVLWNGGDEIYTFDPATKEFRVFDAPAAAAKPADTARVVSKFKYVEEADAFAAISDAGSDMWFYRLPDAEQGTILDPDAPRARVIDTDGNVTEYELIREAVESAPNGATVEIVPGTYQESATVSADNLTIRGEGVHIKDTTTGNKATFIVNGDNTTFEGLEISGARLPDDNGAPIRLQAKDLTLNNVYFHDNQKGLLGGSGTITIQDSRFENNSGQERSHGIYVSDETDLLIVRNSEFIGMNSGGHEIKSRARETVIENSRIASLDGYDSRLIDISNGGKLTIRGSVLESGPNSTNAEMIGFAKEASKGLYEANAISIQNSLIIDDTGSGRSRWLDIDSQAREVSVEADGNVFVGGDNVTAAYYVDASVAGLPSGNNRFFFSRSEAGLDAYPALPRSIDAVDGTGLDTDDPEVINNEAPTAGDDALSTVVGQQTSVQSSTLLANDADPNGDTLRIVGTSEPEHGSLVRASDGTLSYTPEDGFTGSDRFFYTVTDGLGGYSTATVSVSVKNIVDGRIVLSGSGSRDSIDLSDADQPHHVIGAGGHDSITGSPKGDLIEGGSGEDRLWGGEGDDVFVYVGRDNGTDNLLDGGPGYDTIVGSDGDDVMRFRGDSPYSIERIKGGEGYDVIRGWDWGQTWDFSGTEITGIDLIDGHRRTSIIGSKGDDTFKGSGSDGRRIDGGGGRDTVVYDGTVAEYDLVLNEDASITLTGRVANTLENVEVLRFADGVYADGTFDSPATPGLYSKMVSTLADRAVEVDERDLLTTPGSPLVDEREVLDFGEAQHGSMIRGSDGAFTYEPDPGFVGTDRLSYTVRDSDGAEGKGVLTLVVREPWTGGRNGDHADFTDRDAPHQIDAGGGHDSVTGTPGPDLIRGGPGEDRISGGEGDDVFVYAGLDNSADKLLDGGAGFDVVVGSDADDLMQFRGDGVRSIERIDAGDGYDVIRGWKWSQSWDFSETEMTGIDLIDGYRRTDIVGSAGDDTFKASGSDGASIDGGGGHDAVIFDEAFADYTVDTGADGRLVVSGPTDVTLDSIEVLQFSDGVYSDDTFAAGEQGVPEIQDQQAGSSTTLSLVGLVNETDLM